MKRAIFIGKTGSGKTTLCQRLHQLDIKYKKTQAIDIYDYAIDTPGEYLENRGYYTALITTAADADIVAMVIDPTTDEYYIPPSFANLFSKPVIGIVTKINLVEDIRNIQRAKDLLKDGGVNVIFLVDTIDNLGLEELFLYLSKDD